MIDERKYIEKLEQDHIDPMLSRFYEKVAEVGLEKAIKIYRVYFKDLFFGEVVKNIKEALKDEQNND